MAEKKLVLSGKFEDIFELREHFYLQEKFDRICVLPYTISAQSLIDKIGVIEDWNEFENKKSLTLLSDYLSTDDSADLVAANRILFEIIGTNIKSADKWMYLGNVYSVLMSEAPIRIYAVDITGVEIKKIDFIEDEKNRRNFRLLDSSFVVQTDDILFLSSYFRLFNFFYKKSTESKNKSKL